jgi:hypothetical protein
VTTNQRPFPVRLGYSKAQQPFVRASAEVMEVSDYIVIVVRSVIPMNC